MRGLDDGNFREKRPPSIDHIGFPDGSVRYNFPQYPKLFSPVPPAVAPIGGLD
jgi:hypothetical protein